MNFTIPATSKRIIIIVVATLAISTIICLVALSACLVLGYKPDPIVFTAFATITGQIVGSLTTLLSNTRSTPGTDADMPKATIVPDSPAPLPVSVVSSVKDPVHTEEAK